MNPLIQLKKATPLFLVVSMLVCLAVSHRAQAVSPAPDGGYPRGNTAEGQRALLNLTTGQFNSALGFLSLSALTTGNFCTGVGAGALLLNTADGNTAVGAAALLSNTIGTGNTATGLSALGNNMDGIANTANGFEALFSNTNGGLNTATGYQALFANTALGNTATGYQALANNTTGEFNTANGLQALVSNTIGATNTASGVQALFNNDNGFENTAIGFQALYSNTGSDNTAIGLGALLHNTTGNVNIAFGVDAGILVTTASNVIAIGTGGANVSNSCFIGNIRDVTTANANAIPVLIDSAGQLGTMSSSRRFKKEIKPMDKASEAILAFKPVTFHYKSDKTGTPQFGLIAEEVAAVSPELVVRDEKGEIYTVRYDAVNAMLLNEFLKEHGKVQEQQKEINGLKAELKQQRALIQKVSAQIQVSKASPRTALNDQ